MAKCSAILAKVPLADRPFFSRFDSSNRIVAPLLNSALLHRATSGPNSLKNGQKFRLFLVDFWHENAAEYL
jgi:hypothetical protein